MKGENIIILNHDSIVEAVENYINADHYGDEKLKVIHFARNKHCGWRIIVRVISKEAYEKARIAQLVSDKTGE